MIFYQTRYCIGLIYYQALTETFPKSITAQFFSEMLDLYRIV